MYRQILSLLFRRMERCNSRFRLLRQNEMSFKTKNVSFEKCAREPANEWRSSRRFTSIAPHSIRLICLRVAKSSEWDRVHLTLMGFPHPDWEETGKERKIYMRGGGGFHSSRTSLDGYVELGSRSLRGWVNIIALRSVDYSLAKVSPFMLSSMDSWHHGIES